MRLGMDSTLAMCNKPTPVEFFNDPKRFKILDVKCGDDHSFVNV